MSTWKKAAAADPSNAVPPYRLGRLLADLGRNSEALEALDAAYGIAPYDLEVVVARTEVLLASGLTEEALAMMNALPNAYRSLPLAHLARALLQKDAGQYLGVRAELAAAQGSVPGSFDIRLAEALLAFGKDPASALPLFEQLQEDAVPAGRPALEPVLEAYRAVAEGASSRLTAGWWLRHPPPDHARACLVLARFAMAHGAYDVAEAYLEHARQFGDMLEVDLLWARVLATDPARQEQAARILRDIEEACEGGPLCDEARDLLGRLGGQAQ